MPFCPYLSEQSVSSGSGDIYAQWTPPILKTRLRPCPPSDYIGTSDLDVSTGFVYYICY